MAEKRAKKGLAVSDIEVSIASGIAHVVLNRPAQRNAMTLEMWRGMARVFGELNATRDVRAIMLSGAGGNFSVGADISEFGKVRSTARQAEDYEVAVDASSDAIARTSKPTFAVIEGYCLGGGCHLALACDFRIAAPDAAIGIPAAKLSIIYGVRSTQRLLALVGLTAAKRILYSAARAPAQEALAIGLVDEVGQDPLGIAQARAAEYAQNAPLSIAGAKAILDGLAMGPGRLDESAAQRLIDAAADSFDYREGRAAFAERRQPKFRGE